MKTLFTAVTQQTSIFPSSNVLFPQSPLLKLPQNPLSPFQVLPKLLKNSKFYNDKIFFFQKGQNLEHQKLHSLNDPKHSQNRVFGNFTFENNTKTLKSSLIQSYYKPTDFCFPNFIFVMGERFIFKITKIMIEKNLHSKNSNVIDTKMCCCKLLNPQTSSNRSSDTASEFISNSNDQIWLHAKQLQFTKPFIGHTFKCGRLRYKILGLVSETIVVCLPLNDYDSQDQKVYLNINQLDFVDEFDYKIKKSVYDSLDTTQNQPALRLKHALRAHEERNRSILIDLHPNLVYSKEPLVNILVNANISHYLEFRGLTQIWVYQIQKDEKKKIVSK